MLFESMAIKACVWCGLSFVVGSMLPVLFAVPVIAVSWTLILRYKNKVQDERKKI